MESDLTEMKYRNLARLQQLNTKNCVCYTTVYCYL